MTRTLLALLIAAAAVAAAQAVAAEPLREPQRIEFVSYNPDGYDAILSGAHKTDESKIHGDLYLPEGTAPAPVVVLMHGSGGAHGTMPWYRDLIPALHARGIGAFVVDSFSGRGIGETASDQGRLSTAGSALDGFAALSALAGHPRVDKARVGISGYSRGGIAAMNTAHAALAKAALGDGLKFAAHLPVYPSCQAQWQEPTFTGAPMLFLLGGKDDYTPAKFCVDYAARLKAGGAPVEVKVYGDAHHSWTAAYDERACASCAVFVDCGVGPIRPDGVQTDAQGRASTRDGWQPFLRALFRDCGRRGATVGQHAASRADTLKATVEFFANIFERLIVGGISTNKESQLGGEGASTRENPAENPRLTFRQAEDGFFQGDIMAARERARRLSSKPLRDTLLAYSFSYEFLENDFDPVKSRELFLSVHNTPCSDTRNVDCVFSRIFSDVGYARQLLCAHGDMPTHEKFHLTNPLTYLNQALVQIKVAETMISAAERQGIQLQSQSGIDVAEFPVLVKNAKRLATIASIMVIKFRTNLKKRDADDHSDPSPYAKGKLGDCLKRVARRYWEARKRFKESFDLVGYDSLEKLAYGQAYYALKGSDGEPVDEVFKNLEAKVEKLMDKDGLESAIEKDKEAVFCNLTLVFLNKKTIRNSEIFQKCINNYS